MLSVCVVTAVVVMPKLAVLAPWPMVTLGGTDTEVLALDKVTVTPLAGAGEVRFTVPVEGLPPTT